ncbi:MAG: flavin reductase family protein [Dehalococcoidia bacterium]|nr:flavin reductase family protein [Dehalococcoidia bacterium]
MTKELFEQPDIYTSFPTPLALVSCADPNGKGNILTIAWVGVVCSEPPMVSIAMRRGKHSYPLVKANGEFVLNVPTEQLVKETDYCGSVSGKTVDKWETAHLTPGPASKVKAPIIVESPINLECVVRHTLNLGSHDLFLAEVVACHVDTALMKGGKLDATAVRPLLYFCRDYWALAKDRLAKRGVGLPGA